MSRKLICNITGKTLTASKQYYEKKVQKAGSEENLHRNYVCRDAKTLLKKGYNIDEVRTALNVDDKFKSKVVDGDIDEILGTSNTLRINTSEPTTRIGVIKTDPDVRKFVESLMED